MGTATRGVEDAVADAGVRFLLDENVPPSFAEALRLVGYNTVSNKEVNLKGALDPVVIEFCGDKRMVWLTKDMDARKRAAYAGLVRDRRVSAVFLASPRAKRWTMKQQFEVIVKHLRILEGRYDRSTDPRYFICRATGQPLEASTFAARPGR
jgi:predicted nuclease of predicted toxin-antitoxin system